MKYVTSLPVNNVRISNILFYTDGSGADVNKGKMVRINMVSRTFLMSLL
jgi:hypothetical protein